MPITDSDERELSFPLEYSEVIVGDTPDDGTPLHPFSWQTENSDEKVIITLELSLNEYVALATAIDIGRDIGYGAATNLIWWIWVRSVNPMAFCEQVINCINNDPDVMTAIVNALNASGAINPNSGDVNNTNIYNERFSPSARAEDIALLEDCNLDVLWGGLREGIVKYLDDTARNFLEDLVTQADQAQRFASLIERVPLVGGVISTALTQLVELVPDLLNLFNAYSSETILDNISCDLFELVCAECRYPTFDELINYYATLGIAGIDDLENLSVSAMVQKLIGSALVPASIAYHSIITFELFILYLGSKFNFVQGVNTIAVWADIGDELASDNWITLCDGCLPEFPNLVTTRCQDALNLGTLTQIDANHWHVESEVHSDTNSYCFLRDSSISAAATFKILAITNIVHASGFENGTQTSAICVITNVFSWIPGQIGALNRYEYMFSSDVAFSFDIEVSVIGA